MSQLPTREQIEAIDDLESLELLRDDIERDIAKIEVDLEFRPGNDDWAARARSALVAHNICYGQLSRRIIRLSKKAKPERGPSAETIQAKAAKKEAVALRVQAQAQEKLARAESAKVAQRERVAAILERTSWLAFFHKAAIRIVDAETMARVLDVTERDYAGRLKHEVQTAA